MKNLVIVFLLCLLGALHAETRIVSLTDARRIADSNAAILWGGNLGSAEPIPYYGPDDKVIAYHFNYAIGRPFPDKHSLQQRSEEAFSSGNRDLGWGVGEFGNMVIGANRNMPVFVEYSKCLSQQYAYAQKLEEAASREFPKGYELTKTYYLGLVDVWYRINDGNETRYINLEPYTKVKTETEFREMIKDKTFFWERDSFEEEWEYLLDNGNTMSRAEYMVPGEELMPFYEWNYGCTPTSAAMLFAWWDAYLGFGKLVKHHSTKWDPVVGRYTHHVPDIQGILANTMDTDSDGSTYRWNICDGLIDAADIVGYNCASDGLWATHHTVGDLFDGIRSSVDIGRPLLCSIDGHSLCAVGYGTWPSRVFTHDSNQSTLRTISRSMLEGYYWAAFEPLNDVHLVELNSPEGGTMWNSNYGGETLISGIYYDITWSSTISPNAYAKIYYHDEGGWNTDRWFPITANTINDGHFQWLVPQLQDCPYGVNTDYGRVKIEIYDTNTHQLLAADGSYGNFKIIGDYNMPWLGTNPTMINQSNAYCRVNHELEDSWGIVAYRGYRSDIELYQAPDFGYQMSVSQSPTSLNYMLIDNHMQISNTYGIKFTPVGQNLQGNTVFMNDWNSEISTGTTYNYTWQNNNVVKLHKVYLVPGQYIFTLHRESGILDLDLALYAPGSGIYTYDQAAAYSRNPGTNDEVFIYRVATAGYYALVVSCSSTHNGVYTLRIDSTGKWLGTADTNWFNPANWIGNTVPNFTNDVVIPGGCPNYPIILTGTYPEIKSISIEANALLTIGATEMNVHQSMQVYGTINMTSNSSVLSVGENLYWGAGSSLVGSIYNYQIVCYKNWDFGLGSNIQMTSGTVVFWGDQDSYVTTSSATSRFNNVTLTKITAGRSVIHSEYSSNDWRIYGNLTISNSNTTLSSETDKKIQIYSSITNNGHIQLDNGTVDFKIGSSLPVLNTGDYFYGLTISTTTTLSLPSNYSISGDLTISSGGINANTRAITLSGNFINNVGPAGFVKGTSSVIFNGGGDQRCTNGNFYRMEIASQYCNVIFTGAGATSTCDIYDWTAGSLEVEQGTLNILDLADNGLYGNYMLTGGTLNVNQDNSQYTDLNGSLYIYSGTMNVYGGNGNSYWPYAANAHIEMHGGVLDFKNRGIYIYNTPTYTLTTELRGGIIRTAGSFLCYRPDFWFADEHYIELYGSTDANIYLHSSAGFHSFIFNKGSDRADACPAGLDQIEREGVELPVELRSSNSSATRANTVNLISNVYIFGDLIIESGTVNLNSYNLTTESDTDVMGGTIFMNQASARLVTYGRFQWGDNAVLNATAGEMHFYHSLTFAEDSVFQMGTTARFWTEFNTIANYADICQFGNVILEDDCEMEILNYQPITITGNMSLLGESILRADGVINISGSFTDNEYAYTYIQTDMTVNQNILLYGVLTIENSTLTCHGNFQNLAGSLVLSNNGNCIIDRPFDSTYQLIEGGLIISSGVFEVTNNGIQFTNDAYLAMDGGTIRTGWNFVATSSNVFNPDGGSVEFIGDRNATIECNNGNYFYDIVFNKPITTNVVSVLTDLSVGLDFTVLGGNPALNGNNIYISRDMIINGGRVSASSNSLTDIYVARNWINNVGTTAFSEGTTPLNYSTVHFYGAENSIVSTETFYVLRINKSTSGSYTVTPQAGATITAKGPVEIVRGNLQLRDNCILDVNSSINISAGGGLDLSDTSSYGTLYLTGNLYDANTTYGSGVGFDAIAECHVILDGGGDQIIDANRSNVQFYNLTVNKPAGRVMPQKNISTSGYLHLISGEWNYGVAGLAKSIMTNLIIEAAASFTDDTGVVLFDGWNASEARILGNASLGTINIDKGGYSFNLSGNVSLAGTTTLNLTSGNINLNGYTLQMTGTLNLANYLYLQPSSVLSLGNNSVLNVNNGGRFITLGTQANPALVTSHDGNYAFNVNDYGKIGGSWGIYEKMNINGILFAQRTSIDSEYPMQYPTFRNGAPGGSLLRVNWAAASNNVIQNPIFPANTWGGLYNVRKAGGTGSITLQNATGAFSGAAFEYDPYGTVHWTYPVAPGVPQNVQIIRVSGNAVLSWNAVAGVTGYKIYRAVSPELMGEAILVGTTAQTSFTDTVHPLGYYPAGFYFVKSYVD
jgi:hypothetical protein